MLPSGAADWYGEDYYAMSPRFDPPGPTDGTWNTARGGSHENARPVWWRLPSWPGYRSNRTGFRCITKDIPDSPAPRRVERLPDLVLGPGELEAPRRAVLGSSIEVFIPVANFGTADAGRFRLVFYLSADRKIDTTDISTGFGCQFPDGLAARDTSSCSGTIPTLPATGPGTFFLGAFVDDLDRVREFSEANTASKVLRLVTE